MNNNPKVISNWGKTFTYQPANFYNPSSLKDISSTILQCRAKEKQIRAIGSRYSYTPLICSKSAALSLDNFTGIEEINYEELSVVVRGGTKLADLEKALFAKNLSLYNLGDINEQTIAGLIATGSHGTGKNFGIASTQIMWIQMINAAGEIVECSAQDKPELFKAAQVSLGLLGIITKVKLKVLPRYYVDLERNVVDFDLALGNLLSSFENNRNYEFFWFPYTNYVFEKRINIASSEPAHTSNFKKAFNDYVLENAALWLICEISRMAPHLYRKHANSLLKKLNSNLHEQVASTQCYATKRLVNHREIEYSIPIQYAVEAIKEIKELLDHHETHVSFPIEVRCVASDDIYLSPNYNCNTVWIAVHSYTKDQYKAVFQAVEKVFLKYNGRPHWGKMHTLSAIEISKLYPHLDTFKSIRKENDPSGLFLSPYINQLLGIN